MSIGQLQMQVKGAFAWLTVLTTILVTGMCSFSGSLTDVRKDIATVNQAVAVQGQTINDMDKTLTKIDDKLDGGNGDNTQTSPGAGQAGGVSSGTGGGKKPAR